MATQRVHVKQQIWAWGAIAAAVLCVQRPVVTEMLPTRGAFKGFYHCNAAGVGKFRFYIVPEGLKKELARYEGKYIQLEVIQARQPMSPGPAIIQKLGNIKELPQPPLKVEVKVLAPGTRGSGTVDLLYTFTNASKEPVILEANSVAIGLMRWKETAQPDEPDRWLKSGYSRRQLAYGGDPQQRWTFISPACPGRATHFYAVQVRLGAGESAPFIWHGLRLSPGRHEVAVAASCSAGKEAQIRVRAWRVLEIPRGPAATTQPAALEPAATTKPAALEPAATTKPAALEPAATTRPATLEVRGKISSAKGRLRVEARLQAVGPKPVPVFVCHNTGTGQVFLPALIQARDKTGKRVDAAVDCRGDQPHRGNPWACRKIDQDGMPFSFGIRPVGKYDKPIETVSIWLLTLEGIQKLQVQTGPTATAPAGKQ